MSESSECMCPVPETDASLSTGPAGGAVLPAGERPPLDDLPVSTIAAALSETPLPGTAAVAHVALPVAETTAIASPAVPAPSAVDPVATARELVVGSVLGVAYVMFLPFVGIAVPFWLVGERLVRLVKRSRGKGGRS